jgi:hypothetical protein
MGSLHRYDLFSVLPSSGVGLTGDLPQPINQDAALQLRYTELLEKRVAQLEAAVNAPIRRYPPPTPPPMMWGRRRRGSDDGSHSRGSSSSRERVVIRRERVISQDRVARVDSREVRERSASGARNVSRKQSVAQERSVSPKRTAAREVEAPGPHVGRDGRSRMRRRSRPTYTGSGPGSPIPSVSATKHSVLVAFDVILCMQKSDCHF